MSSSVPLLLFWVFALATAASAIGVVVARSPVASAMSLVASFFFLAGIYVLLWAHTIAVLQIMVYAGAIMVLFLFVIMLLSLDETGPRSKLTLSRVLGGVAALGLLVSLGVVFRGLPQPTTDWAADPALRSSFGTLAHVGRVLYTQWLFPFEAVSLLLLAAIVGAVVVAKAKV